jgi:hypothetical protein
MFDLDTSKKAPLIGAGKWQLEFHWHLLFLHYATLFAFSVLPHSCSHHA